MKKLFFIRHGESFANLKRVYGGHSIIGLTEKGKEQAKDSSKFLVNKNITKIISSDLERSLSTANIINIEAGFNLNKLVGKSKLSYCSSFNTKGGIIK